MNPAKGILLLLAIALCVPRTEAQWVQTNGPYGGEIMALAAIDSHLFAGVRNAGIYHSTNSGREWSPANAGFTNVYPWMLFVDGTNLYAGTEEGGAFLSTDLGAHWTAVNAGFPRDPYVWTFARSGPNLYAGTRAGVFLSTNNGTLWTPVNFGLTNNYGLSFAVSGSNVFVGTAGRVFLSTNYGTTWTAADAGPASTWIKSLIVAGPHLFAGTGYNGVWRRPLSEMVTAVSPDESLIPGTFLLDQNYPNPFNPSTIIRYGIPWHSHVTLSVYTTLGQEVARLVDGERDAGYHEVKFDAHGLSSGVYLCRMQAGHDVDTKKFLVIR